MSEPEVLEPAEVVLRRAHERGFRISAAELARWHRAGLVPVPRQQSLGRGKGTRSVYPAGAFVQVIALCQIHSTVRSLNDVGWFLWWSGFPVAENLWRDRLTGEATEWDRAISQLKECAAQLDSDDDNEADEADRSIIRASNMRTNVKLLRRMRKRLGRKRFPSALRLITGLAVGPFDEGPAAFLDDPTIDRILNLDTARTHHLRGAAPWLQGSVRPALATLSETLASNSFVTILEQACDDELHQARGEVRDLLQGVCVLVRGLRGVLGKNPFGLGALADVAEHAKPADLAQLTLGWCLLKRKWPDFRENYLPILSALRGIVSVPQALHA